MDLKAKLYVLTKVRKVRKVQEISMFNGTLDLDELNKSASERSF